MIQAARVKLPWRLVLHGGTIREVEILTVRVGAKNHLRSSWPVTRVPRTT